MKLHRELALISNAMDIRTRKRSRRQIACTALDYVTTTCENFIELRGDRLFSDDDEIVGGYAKVSGQSVVLVVHDPHRSKGRPHSGGSTCLSLSGYRKALRLMRLAEKFNHPLLIFTVASTSLLAGGPQKPLEAVTLVKHVHAMWQLQVPIVLTVLGHRGYGNIFGLWIADRILAFERGSFGMTLLDRQLCRRRVFLKAKTLEAYKIIDTIVPEPFTGADQIPLAMAKGLRESIGRSLSEILSLPRNQLVRARVARADRVLALELRIP